MYMNNLFTSAYMPNSKRLGLYNINFIQYKLNTSILYVLYG